MNVFIITGASRGLGESIVKNLMKNENEIICISRTVNKDIIELAHEKNVRVEYIDFDLNDIYRIEELFEEIFEKIEISKTENLYLINNAGVIVPIKPMGKIENEEIIDNVKVNMIAPILMTNVFLKKTKEIYINKVVLNISSGAAVKPVYGWGAYCSSKSGLNMFSQVSALEQEKIGTNTKIISFAPGVVDTSMQHKIRNSKEKDFIDVKKFIDLKNNGILLTPGMVASKIVELLIEDELENGGVYHINDFLQ
ncbi:(S)-benzoin forming benzil reductase [Oceanotoga sp. DSM 15011]|uniref:(S)-benzoin forming benzil reductase n=1 Tax=Oceanotoga sp. DSM 15011 TaxID=2984951 RepID=UPI0021F3E636|nr:(S)-benzoin forming benzil reductase [Oceanotoga sp. DSM 15011]UYP01001.1 (S)-benzoin forming benzil reductase [Oceanotoga sp. DSM 15011]